VNPTRPTQEPAPAHASDPPAEATRDATTEARVLGMQQQAGNRATSLLLGRRPTGAAPPRPKAFGEGVSEMLASEAPVLLGLIPVKGIEDIQAQVDAKANNEAVDREKQKRWNEIAATQDFQDPQMFNPGVTNPEDFKRIDRGRMDVKNAPNRFTVDAQAVLDGAGIRTPRSPNNSLEKAFRDKIWADLTKGPITAEIAPMRSGPRRMQLGVTYYSSDNWTLDHTKGIIHFDDLTRQGGRYGKEYEAEVANSPELRQLTRALALIRQQIDEIKKDHFERSKLNKEHGIVRHISEAFGGADMADYLEVLLDVKRHPDHGTLEQRLAELENPYPSVTMWEVPEGQLAQAQKFLENGDFDLAMIGFMQASGSAEKATERYQRYEEKVMKGAGIAVKWLTRLKTAGKLAVGVATGGLALPAQAAVAAGYAFLQEGAQQEAEVAYGLRSSVDLGGLAKMAATEGAMTFFGGLTQGAFTKTLTARFEVSLAEKYGPAIAKRMISGTAAATSTFYNVPANIVLSRIIAGEPMPKSMEALADMIVEETKNNVMMDFGMGFLPHPEHGKPGAGEPATPGAGEPATERRTAPDERAGSAEPGHPGGEHVGPDTAPGAVGSVPQSVDPSMAGGAGKGAAGGEPHILELASQARSVPAAREALIDHFKTWEEAIAGLKEGTGAMAGIAAPARAELIQALVAHRQELVGKVASQFGAEQARTASAEPGSDVDLNMTGPDAGAHAAEAMAFLDGNHPGWRKRFRMDVMVDATRSKTLADALATLPAGAREGISRRQAMATEAFLVAREARNAKTPAERTALLEGISVPELKDRAKWMADLDPAAAKAEQLKLLTHSDRAVAAIDPKGTSADRAAQIGEALDTQALANALDPEAYISTGAIRSVVLGEHVDVTGRYEAVIEQLDMLHHQAHEAGGMGIALRKYETYKYVQRICDQLTAAGVKDPRIAFLRNQGEMVYKMDRGAMSSEKPRTVSPQDATGKSSFAYEEYGEVPGVTDQYLRDVHQLLEGVVNDHLPLLRRQALGSETHAAEPLPVRVPELGPLEPPARAPEPAGGMPQSTGTTTGTGPAGAPPSQATGLRDPNAVVRVADALVKAGAPVAGTSLKAHADTILSPIAGELASVGTKPPQLDVVDLGNPLTWGYFDAVRNVIVVNEGALANGKPAFDLADPVGRQRLANLVFHESRHAEQYFHAMRYIAQATGGTGMPTQGIHPDIVAAALAHPVQTGAPEFEVGKRSWEEFFGPDHAKMQFGQDFRRTQALRNGIEQATAARDLAYSELQSVRWWQLGKTPQVQERVAKLQKLLFELKTELDYRNRTYAELFHEQDAWAAGGELDKALPQARLRAAERAMHNAWDGIDVARRWLPAEEAGALDASAAAMRAYWEALEAVGQSMRGQPAAAPPAAVGAAPAGASKP
jgi:hypothetical protein